VAQNLVDLFHPVGEYLVAQNLVELIHLVGRYVAEVVEVVVQSL